MANGQKIYCRQFADVPPSGWKRWVACGSGCVWGPVARIRNGNHSGNTQISSDFSSPISFAFSKNRDGEGEPEREPMNHAWDTNRTKRFASAPVPAPAAAPFPPRPPSIFHSSICWKSGINQSTSQNMFSFASSHPKVKC